MFPLACVCLWLSVCSVSIMLLPWRVCVNGSALCSTLMTDDVWAQNKKTEPAYGVDVLRLWVAMSDTTQDITVGPTIIGIPSFRPLFLAYSSLYELQILIVCFVWLLFVRSCGYREHS